MASNTPYTPDINSDSADFVPSMGDYKTLQPFRYWCQKVLPLVYDDSLSYYELLCKVVDYLNKSMEDVETLHDDVDDLHAAYGQLQNFTNVSITDLRSDYQNLINYVNGYFASVNVQQEINNKLDAMALDGSLSALLAPFIPSLVSAWLAEHITPTTPAVDDTLSIAGAAADAKATGDRINALDTDLTGIDEQLYYGSKYRLESSNFEFGGISYTQSHLVYQSTNKQVRTKENYSVSLHKGDIVSIGDAKAILTLAGSGDLSIVDISIMIYWLNPETNLYVKRDWSKTDFEAPATTSYYFILHIDGEANYLSTTYTDAIEKMSQKILITTYDYSTLRSHFDTLVESYEATTPELLRRSIRNPICKFVAHQGYTADAERNNDVLSGYAKAAKRGFDWAETDVRTTSDGYLVCAHDPTFVDATSGVTVTIATSTLAELQTHDFYGSTIATLDAVVKSCKANGIGLIMDQVGTTDEINGAYDICKKYGMLDNVGWCIGLNSSLTSLILTNYPKSKLFLLAGADVQSMSDYITYGNSIATDDNEVYLYFPYSLASAENMESNYELLNDNVHFAIWTVNYMPYLTPRLPYISFVTSDKIAYYDYYVAQN